MKSLIIICLAGILLAGWYLDVTPTELYYLAATLPGYIEHVVLS